MDHTTLIGMSHETYELLNKLGEGGFGEVYLARKRPLQKLVALKLLQHKVSSTAEQRLWDEALLLAQLHHPNILAADDLVRLHGRLGLVTEYIEGEDLSSCLDDGMPASAVVEVVAQVAWALHAASQKGVVHRDVKPQNVRIGRHGNVKLLDFGIAFSDTSERTSDPTQGMVGTPRYMAPERFRFEFAPASDVFSLGCILWLGVEGTHFYGENSTFEQIVPFTRSSLRWSALLGGAFHERMPRGLEELLFSMLAREPHARPSAADVARRCEAILEHWPDRKRLGEWCRERWPDGVPVPSPVERERTTSSLLVQGERAPSSEDDITEDAETEAAETEVAEPDVPKPPPLPLLPGRTISPFEPTIARPTVKPPPREGASLSLVGLALTGLTLSGLLLGAVIIAFVMSGQTRADGRPPSLVNGLFGWELPKTTAAATGSGTPSKALPLGADASGTDANGTDASGTDASGTDANGAAIDHTASTGERAAGLGTAEAPANAGSSDSSTQKGNVEKSPSSETPGKTPAGSPSSGTSSPTAPPDRFGTRSGALTDPVAIREMISGRLTALTPDLRSCYSASAAGDPSLTGRWRLSFSVLSSGEVGDVTVSALEKPNAALESCIVGHVRNSWRFETIAQAQPVTRTLRFP